MASRQRERLITHCFVSKRLPGGVKEQAEAWPRSRPPSLERRPRRSPSREFTVTRGFPFCIMDWKSLSQAGKVVDAEFKGRTCGELGIFWDRRLGPWGRRPPIPCSCLASAGAAKCTKKRRRAGTSHNLKRVGRLIALVKRQLRPPALLLQWRLLKAGVTRPSRLGAESSACIPDPAPLPPGRGRPNARHLRFPR